MEGTNDGQAFLIQIDRLFVTEILPGQPAESGQRVSLEKRDLGLSFAQLPGASNFLLSFNSALLHRTSAASIIQGARLRMQRRRLGKAFFCFRVCCPTGKETKPE